MKKFIISALFLALSMAAFAQTATEIVERMDKKISAFDEKDGVGFVMEM